MKRNIRFVSLLVSAICLAALVSEGRAERREREAETLKGFRGCSWGMSVDQVKAVFEEQTFKTYRGDEYFADRIAGLRTFVTFFYGSRGLARVELRIRPRSNRGRDMLNHFQHLEDLLVHRFGPPKSRIRRGSDLPFVADWLAILADDGGYITRWEGEKTDLHLTLTGDGSQVLLNLTYSNPERNEELAKERFEEQASAL